MVDGLSVYPEYLSESRVLTCLSSPDAVERVQSGIWNRPDGPNGSRMNGSTNPCLLSSISYFYTGFLLEGRWIEEPGTGDVSTMFLDSFSNLFTGNVELLENTWTYEDDFGQIHNVMRLKEGIERFLITDINNPSQANIAQSAIPAMFDRIDMDPMGFNHLPGGGNILYMDGHVSFEKYPGDFPINRTWADVVDRLNL